MRMIRIFPKKDGFRRCGVAHSGTADHPLDRFTAGELAQLKAEPMLSVTEIEIADPKPDPSRAPSGAPPEAGGGGKGGGKEEKPPRR